MSTLHSLHTRRRFDRTIQALCPFIEDRIKTQVANVWSEYDLRKELVGCILGSQVRHEMALASTENLDQAGLLDDTWWFTCRDDSFGSAVFHVLSRQRHDLPHRGPYRFFRARTRQLTRAR